jgi:two-component system OmpR family response regulator
MRVLVVEDDPGMADVLARGMRESGFAVDVTSNGQDGLWLAADIEYDIVVLDIGLPDVDGLHVLARLRAAKRWMPVLLLTARDAVDDRVIGLDGGADDYLTKPFAFPELLARIRALVRRGPRERSNVLVVGDLELDPAAREVRRAGTPVPLTSKEFALLECFMLAPGEVLTRTHLIEHVWDVAFDADSNVVDVYVGYLRAKIDRQFGRNTLQTVRGSGYVLRDEDAAR